MICPTIDPAEQPAAGGLSLYEKKGRTSMIYTVTFNPAVDYVVHTGAMQLGLVNRSSAEEIYFGGKGINVSFVLQELGIPSVALGFIAGFTGDAIEQGVQEKGVTADFIRLPEGFSRINVKIKSGTETELNGQGPRIGAQALDALFRKLTQLEDGDTLVLAGSIPNTLPSDMYEQILRQLSGKHIRAVVDASGELLRRVLPYRPFLIKPNHHELEELFGKPLHSMEEIAACAEKLRQEGAQNVLVSMAENGALLIDESGARHVCGVCRGTVKNSVGAGDSMLAGFLAGITEGDAAHALKLGTAAGGATAFSEGLAERALIDRLLQQLQ